jgi:hypothetical protein
MLNLILGFLLKNKKKGVNIYPFNIKKMFYQLPPAPPPPVIPPPNPPNPPPPELKSL